MPQSRASIDTASFVRLIYRVVLFVAPIFAGSDLGTENKVRVG